MSDYNRDQNAAPMDYGPDADTQMRDRKRDMDMDMGGGNYGQDLGAQGRTPVLDADMGAYGDQAGGLKGDLTQKDEGLLGRAKGVFDKGVGSAYDDANSGGMQGSSSSDSVQDTFSDADGRLDTSDADTHA